MRNSDAGKPQAPARAASDGRGILEAGTPWFLLLLAMLAAGGAIIRVLGHESNLKRVDRDTLVYLAVAGALLLLRNVKTLAFGDYKLEFEQVRQLAADAKTAAEDAKSVAVGTGRTPMERKLDGAETESRSVTAAADPNKEMFGGRAYDPVHQRLLHADVVPLNDTPGFYRVHLEVVSARPRTHPLTGSVQFFLHPTFNNPAPIVRVGPNGAAELDVNAWGAFTVGARADGNATELELDLADLPSAPEEFRAR
jgi:hypothetical protein